MAEDQAATKNRTDHMAIQQCNTHTTGKHLRVLSELGEEGAPNEKGGRWHDLADIRVVSYKISSNSIVAVRT